MWDEVLRAEVKSIRMAAAQERRSVYEAGMPLTRSDV